MKKKEKPDRKVVLADLAKEAAKARNDNRALIRELRRDPGLADGLKEILCADLRRVASIPRDILGPSSSRQRYRELGHYSPSLAEILFGMWAEFQRQAELAPTLQRRTVERNISKTARAQDEANYADQHVKPWDGAYNKLKTDKPFTLAICSDLHSHFCNPFALRVWNDVLKATQPQGVRFNGDLVDFPQLSTHRQLPGHFPLSVQQEIDWAVDKVLRPARKALPNADIKFVMGNHDVRLVTYLADKGPKLGSLRNLSFADQFHLDELEIGLVCRANFLNPSGRHRRVDVAQNWETICAPDGRPLWTTVHGFLTGKDAPRKHVGRFMSHGTNGHLHDRQMISVGSFTTGVLHWHQTPCMAHPKAVAAGYIQGPAEATGWSCGFLVVTIHPATNHVHAEWATVGDEIATFRDMHWKIRQSERDQIQEMLEV